MKKMQFLTSFVLVALITVGTHGLFFEVPHDDLPLYFTAGTGGVAFQYHVDASDEVFFRPGVSFGPNGITPAATLGYKIPDTQYDVRVGLFDAKPYIGVGIEL